jgi:hypothetical protein
MVEYKQEQKAKRALELAKKKKKAVVAPVIAKPAATPAAVAPKKSKK